MKGRSKVGTALRQPASPKYPRPAIVMVSGFKVTEAKVVNGSYPIDQRKTATYKQKSCIHGKPYLLTFPTKANLLLRVTASLDHRTRERWIRRE